MQSRYLTDTKAIDVFMACMNRIRSMALIHNKLYQSEGLSHIDICDYVQDLSRNLLSTCLVDTRIELNLDIDPLSLTIDTVMPLGLLINELLTNSLKHAFPEKMFNVRGSTFEVRCSLFLPPLLVLDCRGHVRLRPNV